MRPGSAAVSYYGRAFAEEAAKPGAESGAPSEGALAAADPEVVDLGPWDGRETAGGSRSSRAPAGDALALSFYAYAPPGAAGQSGHSDFVRAVSSNLPFKARPQRPSRTIQDWIVACASVGEVLAVVEAHGEEFDCINTATAMHRIAKCHRDRGGGALQRDPRWDQALGQVRRNLPEFHSRHLSGTLWSLATLHYRGKELDMVMGCVQQRVSEFTCVDLALTAWSLATLRIEPPGLYDTISRLAIPKINEFQPQALTNICWATATLRKENDALVRNAAIVAAKHIDAGVDFKPHEYSTLVWSMVITQAREEYLFNRVAACTMRRLPEFGPQELTNTVWAFASLGVKTDGLFEAIASECQAKLPRFNTQNITNLAWAYTHLALDSPELLAEVGRVSQERIGEMNVQDLAQLALSLVFARGHDQQGGHLLGSHEATVSLVRAVVLAMVEKLQCAKLTYPDDAWITHDLVLVWMDESEADRQLGEQWATLDSHVSRLFEQVHDFFRFTPLLRYAQPCGAVVQTVHMEEYQRGFRALDLRSLGIRYTGRLLRELNLMGGDADFRDAARRQLELDHAALLAADPGAGSQNWCFFRFEVSAVVGGETVTASELNGIRVRSCGGDPVAMTLLDAPFEAHMIAVKLSNDRLNHRKRDAEFRAMAHVAGVLRKLLPDADRLMEERIWWGKSVRGWFKVYVTEVPCLSCLGAMVQFLKRFPNIDLQVTFPGGDR